jgi:hypothetical protein
MSTVVQIVGDNTTVFETTDDQAIVSSQVTGLQGPQGIQGATGATGATGAQGSSGVVNVTSPITNSGTSTSAQLGFDQTAQNTTNDGRYAQLAAVNAFTVGGHTITAQSASVVPLLLKGASSHNTNFFQITDNTNNDVFTINLSGFVRTNIGFASTTSGLTTFRPNFDTSGWGFSIANAAHKGVVVRGAASQSADLQQWQDSTGAIISRVTSAGSLFIGAAGAGTRISAPNGDLLAIANSATIVPIVSRGAASQTGNLQEWQNSGATAVGFMSSVGAFRALAVSSLTNYAGLREESSGGFLRMTKLTAAATNVSSGVGILYFRDGTTAGTLKLVVRAGAAGAETTILDNIPQ